MVICKFFMQGSCRNGESCKFEHGTDVSNYANSSGNTVRQSNFGTANARNATKPPVDTKTLVDSVMNDMNAAEKGGQWLLTSYAPFKEKAAFPGFEDQSFEEVRWGFYEAQKNGTVEQYKQQLQATLQNAILRFKALQQPNQEIINMLTTIYNTPIRPTHVQNCFWLSGGLEQNTFGKSNFSSLPGNNFANANPTNSIFGGNQNNSPLANQNTSVVNQNQSPFGSTFGRQQSATFTTNNSVFSQPNTQNQPFANSPLNSGTTVNQASQQSIFTNNKPTQSPFSQPQSIFNQGNIFQQNSQQQNTIFQQSNQSGVIGAGQSVFRQPTQSNSPMAVTQQFPSQQMMEQGQSQPNVVQNQQAPVQVQPQPFHQATQQVPSNIFGGSMQTHGGSMQTQQNKGTIDKDAYSKIEDLTQEEIDWFNSDSLDIDKIPLKPPTYEMCFGA